MSRVSVAPVSGGWGAEEGAGATGRPIPNAGGQRFKQWTDARYS